MRASLIGLAVVLAAACGHAPPALARPAPAHPTDGGAENALGSPASVRDRALMDWVETAFPGDTTTSCKLGGECWSSIRDVTCDRDLPRCTATGAADVVDPESPRTMDAADNAVLGFVHELDALGLCDFHHCAVRAIACFSNRHDEVSSGIEGMEAHETYTCTVSRAGAP
jgi:hypothetical protein